MGAVYIYAGPDGEEIRTLPDGTGAAIGSEYCTHLLPGADSLRSASDAARARGMPLLLLTPYFRDRELKAFVGLLRAIPGDVDVDVAVNDWGALLAAHTLFPRLGLSLGRLLSGQKRCPRIGTSSRLSDAGRAWYGEGLFSSEAAREYLRREFGLSRFHVDRLEWGPGPPGRAQGAEKFPASLVFHGPDAIVTVSDACPWIGGRSSSSVPSCPRPCRRGSAILRNPSMGRELVQRGKARFVRGAPVDDPAAGLVPAGSRVVYPQLP